MRTTINLKVNGKALEMGDARMSLDLINPIFNELSDYSLPFQIPVTENNLDILGIDHDINTFVASGSFEDVVLTIGLSNLYGTLLIEGSGTANFLSGTFYSGRSVFFANIKGKYLTDIIYSEFIANGYVTAPGWLAKATDSAHHFYPDYNYVFAPVWMPNLTDDDLSGTIEPEIVNKWDTANNTFYAGSESKFSSYFAPFFYLCFVLKKLFESFGYVIEVDELYDNEDFRQLVVFHTNVKDKIEYADFSVHLPYILISDFLTSLEKKLNLRFVLSKHSNTVKILFINSIITAVPVLDITEISDPQYKLTIDRTNGFTLSAELNTDEEDLTGDIGNLPELNNSSFTDIINNIADLPVSGVDGDLVFVKNKSEIYIWAWDDAFYGHEWRLASSSFITMKTKGSNILSLDHNTKDLLMFEPVSETVKYIPKCDDERSLRLWTGSQNPDYKNVTLLFFRGKVPYSAVKELADRPVTPSPGDYCYVSDVDLTYMWDDLYVPSSYEWIEVSVYLKNGSITTMDVNYYPSLSNSFYFKVTDDYFVPYPGSEHNLSNFSTEGLYDYFFEKYIYWLQNLAKKETRKLNIDDAFLSNYEYDIIVTIKNQNYFISRIPMEIDFAKQSIEFGESELLSL